MYLTIIMTLDHSIPLTPDLLGFTQLFIINIIKHFI